jgi:A/G-specific adenine glycosylase
MADSEQRWAETEREIERVRAMAASEGVSHRTVERFRAVVFGHYADAGRTMPWRETCDPYEVLVSEVMLQQTQVSRVAERYPRFLDAFPDVDALAGAPLSHVLELWTGLGYNRRAVALHQAAAVIVGEHDGRVPGDVETLETLPGVGPATAAGVAAFAYGTPTTYLETNVRAAMLHCLVPLETDVSDVRVRELVELTVDERDPRTWYYALMDLGAEIKRRYPNPSRRSRHHRPQGPFEGSNRQLRGRTLRAVLDRGAVTPPGLANRLSVSGPEASRVLEELAGEGFLVEEDGSYRIAEGGRPAGVELG